MEWKGGVSKRSRRIGVKVAPDAVWGQAALACQRALSIAERVAEVRLERFTSQPRLMH